MAQQMLVICTVHRAFLEIAEFQTIIKEIDCGPLKDESQGMLSPRDPSAIEPGRPLHVWPARQPS
jgi:hypothetical protein